MTGDRVYRVIVADDEPDFRRWLASMLEGSNDFSIVGEARNGAEALQQLDTHLPDIVIADMYMPDPDGLEVVRFVQKYYPGTKAILVSAQEEKVYADLAKEEGALAFIPKAKLSLPVIRSLLAGS